MPALTVASERQGCKGADSFGCPNQPHLELPHPWWLPSLGPSVPAMLYMSWSPALLPGLTLDLCSDSLSPGWTTWMTYSIILSVILSPFVHDWPLGSCFMICLVCGCWWTLLPAPSSAHCVQMLGPAPCWVRALLVLRSPLAPSSPAFREKLALAVPWCLRKVKITLKYGSESGRSYSFVALVVIV